MQQTAKANKLLVVRTEEENGEKRYRKKGKFLNY